jgi:protein-L-isoaspartate(D-aspartate) O-methyltransferase
MVLWNYSQFNFIEETTNKSEFILFPKTLLTRNIYFSNNENKVFSNNKLENEDYSVELNAMLTAIKKSNDEIKINYPLAIISSEVLAVMVKVPRHKFVLEKYINYAYDDTALSIDCQQTISQPYIVALMTSLLDLNNTSKVLEIGTGSGYQTAILANLVNNVFTIEVIPELSKKAKKILASLGYKNIFYSCRNGKSGWKKHAPFDAIIVTAAAHTEVLPNLISQLKVNGKLVIPLEEENGKQYLYLISKMSNGSIVKKNIMPVRFVPMV